MTDTLDAIAREIEAVLRLVSESNVPELTPFGGHVDSIDGDTVADCYHNAAHEQDAGNVAHAIAAAVNLIRDHGQTILTALSNQGEGEVACFRYVSSDGDAYNPFIRDWVDGAPTEMDISNIQRHPGVAFQFAYLHPAEADRRDAERYRWLRCGGWEVLQDPKYWQPELKFDGAIDAAIAATQEQT